MADTNKPIEKDSVPFYPDHVSTELKVVIGLVVLAMIVGVIGLISPVGIGEPADPMNTPTHVKPEWYFLSLYQLLKYIPKTIGAVIPVLAVGLLFIWPFLDHKADTTKRIYRIRFALVGVLLVVLIALTIWGEVS